MRLVRNLICAGTGNSARKGGGEPDGADVVESLRLTLPVRAFRLSDMVTFE